MKIILKANQNINIAGFYIEEGQEIEVPEKAYKEALSNDVRMSFLMSTGVLSVRVKQKKRRKSNKRKIQDTDAGDRKQADPSGDKGVEEKLEG